MEDRPERVQRQSLSDELAQRVRRLIQQRDLQPGDRLPSILRLARDFGVAPPTVREALRKLEMLGVVEIRHGLGVFVGSDTDPLLVRNPFEGAPGARLLLDLVDARISIEPTCAALAAENATPAQLAALGALMDRAEAALPAAEAALNEANLAFHREIARASGNLVLHQLLDALGTAMRQEQRIVNHTRPLRERFHAEHLAILRALEARDPAQAVERMRTHLEGVRNALLTAGSPDTNPT